MLEKECFFHKFLRFFWLGFSKLSLFLLVEATCIASFPSRTRENLAGIFC